MAAGCRESLRRFLDGKAGKEAELGHLRRFGIFAGQDRQRLVEVEDGVRIGLGDRLGLREVQALRSPPCFIGLLAAGVVDEDAAHGLGGGGEEMAAAVPVRAPVAADQPQVGFVDQRRGLQRLPGLLLGQPLRGQLAQFVVDQRQELLRGVRVALLDGGQDAGDVIHDRPVYSSR